MKKNRSSEQVSKVMAGVLSGVLAVELVGAVALTNVRADEKKEKNESTDIVNELTDKAYDLFKDYMAEDITDDPTKSETVYVIADANGNTKNIIVSDWISNPQHEATLLDASTLQDLTNVKDDRGYTKDGEGLIWDAQGADIYYKGTTEAELPVKLTVTYYLDGEEITPDNLAGKSGNVTMRFDYENIASKTVTVDGNEETIYVPFVAMTGMMLDNEHFHNVKISSGKLINDGNRTIVLGFALPGLEESLALEDSTVEIPSYVEVTAETVDFSLLTTMTLVTSGIMNEVHFDDVDSLEDLQQKLDQLDQAANDLMAGTATLYENLDLIATKSGDLVDGIATAADGAKLLAEAGVTLSAGVSDAKDGSIALQAGLAKLDANSKSLTDGAATVFNSLLTNATSQITAAGLTLQGSMTIGNYNTVLENTIAYYTSPEVFAGMLIAAYNSNIVTNYGAPVAHDYTEYQTYVAAVSAGAGVDIDAQLRAGVTDTVNNQIVPALRGAQSSLNSYNTFYQGVLAYTQGVAQASVGAEELMAGMKKLDAGAAKMSTSITELKKGLFTIKTGAEALEEGLGKLRDGAKTLDEGMNQFYTDGISKLLTAVNLGEINVMLDRLEAIAAAGYEYQNFSGLADGMNGTVKFLIETESIQK